MAPKKSFLVPRDLFLHSAYCVVTKIPFGRFLIHLHICGFA